MSSREISNQSILLQPPVVNSRRDKKKARDDFGTPAERHYHHLLHSQGSGEWKEGVVQAKESRGG